MSFNLNVPRYVDISEPEEQIDIQEAYNDLKDTYSEQDKLKKLVEADPQGTKHKTLSQIQKPKKGYKKVKWLFGKEIEIPQEWEIKKLEETGEIISGGTPDSTNKDYWNGAILWAVPTDITKLKVNQIEDTKRKNFEARIRQ